MINAYDVGVSISLVDRASGGLGSITHALMQAGGATQSLQARVKALHAQMMQLQALGQVGSMMFHGAADGLGLCINAAKEYQFELTKMNLKGMTQVEIAKTAAQQWKMAASLSQFTPTAVAKVQMDLRAATGTTEHAMDLTPAALKEILVMRASGSYGDSLEKAGESIFAGAKALELQGAFSHKDKNGSAVPYVQSQLDLMRRVATATQGRVNFNDYLAVNQQAGMAVSNYSDEYRYKDRPLMMMEYKRAQGGSAVKWGTIEAAIYSNLIQGSMSKAAAMRLERDHILDPRGQRINSSTLGTIVMSGLAGRDTLMQNPKQWVEKYATPKILESHPEIAAIKDENQRRLAVAGEIAQWGLRQTTTRGLSSIARQMPQFAREHTLIGKSQALDKALPNAQNSPGNAEDAVKGAYNTALLDLGKQALPVVIPLMRDFGAAIAKVGQFLHEHPLAAKLTMAVGAATALVGGILMIGAPIVALGLAIGVTASTVGTVALTITLAVGGIAALIMRFGVDWSAKMRSWAASGMSALANWLGGVQTSVLGFFNMLLDKISTFAINAAKWIGTIPFMGGVSDAAVQNIKAGTAYFGTQVDQNTNNTFNNAKGMLNMGSQVAQNWQTAPASKQTTTIHNSVTMTVNHHGEFNEKHAKQITDHVMSALDKKSRQQAYATYPNSVHTSKYSHGLGSD